MTQTSCYRQPWQLQIQKSSATVILQSCVQTCLRNAYLLVLFHWNGGCCSRLSVLAALTLWAGPWIFNKRWVLYSGKFSYGANFHIHVLHAKIKTTKIWTIRIFAWTLTLLRYDIKYGHLVFCQIFEWPTQTLLINRTIETEAKKAHKPGARSPWCAVGHRWVAWAWSCSFSMRN